jgi:hypothetical protein
MESGWEAFNADDNQPMVGMSTAVPLVAHSD